MGLASTAPATRPATGSETASASARDACSDSAQWSRRLFVPGDSGYLARIPIGDAPLSLRAGPHGALPAEVEHGPLAYAVQSAGRACLNPTLVVRRGARVRATLDNALDAPTIVHWHGLSLDTRNDGSGMYLAAPGERFEYAFDVRNRAGLYWYHAHPHGMAAGQVYRGLYGTLEIEDDDEIALRKALDLAPGRTELVLVLQDRRAAAYAPTESDTVHGFVGDDLYVNGTHCAWHEVGTRLYRLRLLNACNARTLRLAFRTAAGARVPFMLIGTDGGLLESPRRCEQVFFAAAERLDVLLDLTAMPVGETIVLESLAFDPMHTDVARSAGTTAASAATGQNQGAAATSAPAGHDHGSASGAAPGGAAAHHHDDGETTATSHAHGAAWPEGAQRALLEFRVRERVAYDRKIPARLSTVPAIDVANARERPLRLGFNKGRWRINDRVFVMGETPIEVARDTTEVWLLRNYYTSMPHAMHLHGFQFQVIERETSPDFVAALKVDDKGRLATDLGVRDTVLVWPGESVRIAIRFDLPWPGEQTYVFHCHNLEHEDGGMMVGVKVA